jgi:hypothetical protein
VQRPSVRPPMKIRLCGFRGVELVNSKATSFGAFSSVSVCLIRRVGMVFAELHIHAVFLRVIWT